MTEIEEGYMYARLRALGWTIARLHQNFGAAPGEITSRINLTRLHPDIKELLDPKLQRKQRLQVTIGGVLGGVKAPKLEELRGYYETFASYLNAPGIVLAKSSQGSRRTISVSPSRRFCLRSYSVETSTWFGRSISFANRPTPGGVSRVSGKEQANGISPLGGGKY